MKTLLFIDDEERLLRLYAREFESLGYRVLTAPDARTAHDIVRREPPDCAVVDIRLPDQDGLSLIRQMLRENPTIPVVINTALQDAREHFASWCARAFVVKSSNLQELKDAVAAAIAASGGGPAPTPIRIGDSPD